jgi:catechol 2,3-dioxygenase-like lactoylglutathione lyase family enzyme
MNPTILGVIETAIYVDDLGAAEDFYGRVLGLRVTAKEAGRNVFFHVGDRSVLLAFVAEVTIKGDKLPSHGTTGPGHFALGIEAAAIEFWRNQLQAHAIPIEREVVWPGGGRSLYFRDPAGNSVELVTPGIWGLPSGW